MEFELDPRLENDTIALGEFGLSRVLLARDSRFPWIILVPKRPNITELHDLPAEELSELMDEIKAVSKALLAVVPADKINVGALGNIVRQLHIHIVARRQGDAAWPGPVWGHGAAVPYEAGCMENLTREISRQLDL